MSGGFPPGVRPLDHTADIGMDIEAGSLAVLFDRAALGMMAFLAGDDLAEGAGAAAREAGSRAVRELELEAADAALLLVDWLREILLACEAEGVRYAGASFGIAEPTRLRAALTFEQPEEAPVREIKGVTYHGLRVEHDDDGWNARVVFDV